MVEFSQSKSLAAHEIDEQIIESLEPNRLVLERERNGIGREKGVIEAEHCKDAIRAGWR